MSQSVANVGQVANEPVSVDNLFRFPPHAVPAFHLTDYMPWMGGKPQMNLIMNEVMAKEIHDLILECVEPSSDGQDNHLLALARRIQNFFTHRNYQMDAPRLPVEPIQQRRRFSRTGVAPSGG